MCRFFSLTSDGKGNIKYFNWEQRKKILNKEDGYKNYNTDSHTSINDFYGFKGADEDIRNKYEYNPLTKVFAVDKINSIDDSEIVKEKVKALDFKEIVEPLIVKPIVHPFRDIPKVEGVEEKHLELLKKWASVWTSVRVSVWASVWDSVGGSVRGSVWDSVMDSVYAYISSFFTVEKWEYIDYEPFTNPYQPVIDLWNIGIVPSFDGNVWRLHSGKNADVIWEGTV